VVVEEAEFAESKAAADRNAQQTPPPSPDTGADGFMNIPDGIEEELPFD
jgi:single-strand DNA-binding protein